MASEKRKYNAKIICRFFIFFSSKKKNNEKKVIVKLIINPQLLIHRKWTTKSDSIRRNVTKKSFSKKSE